MKIFEPLLTQSSKRILFVAVLSLASLNQVFIQSHAYAAGNTTISGRVYNLDTGEGIANVTINLCGAGNAVSGPSGDWGLTVPDGTAYCARVTDGVPAGLSQPVVRNNPEVGSANSYEEQIAGVNCYHVSSCTPNQQIWDRPIDGGLDFAYSQTPKKDSSQTSSTTATPLPQPSPSATAPSGFTAKLNDSDHKSVNLTWAPYGDPSTFKSFKLERSIDNVNFELISDNLLDPSYADQNTLSSIHYYYRLSILLQSGSASEFALADISTGDVLGSSSQSDTVYISDNKLARVTVKAGSMVDGGTCVVQSRSQSFSTGNDSLISGPYELKCKDQSGTEIVDFKQPVTWRFELSSAMSGFQNPHSMFKGGDRESSSLRGEYDSSSKTLKVEAPYKGEVEVLATKTVYSWITYIVVGVGVIGGLGLLALIPAHTRKKMSYQEYLRAKYYDL